MCRKYYLVMVLPSPGRHPLAMFTPYLSRNDRLAGRGLRMPIAVSGAAVLGLSLLLSVGPVLGAGNGNGANGNSSGAGGNGTTGNVKVHDAGTGVETSGGDNEPHVCDFWLGFTLDAPFEAGTWVVVSWAPTGDGSTVASGVYDTAGDGIDNSDVIEVPAGHYRVEWAATGATVSKKKTFWVDAECGETVTPEDESPAEESAPPADESPVEESAPPVEESPAEQPSGDEGSSPPDESPAQESAPPTEESVLPADESAPPIDESPAEELASPVEESQEAQSSGDETPGDGAPGDESPAEEVEPTVEDSPVEDAAPPADEPPLPVDEELDPSDESVIDAPASPGDASVEEQSGQAAGPSSTDPGVPPMQEELDGTGVNADPTMSDTAAPTPSMPGGLLPAFIALLLVIRLATIQRRTIGKIGV